jgi:hypothetical protein
VETVAQFLQYKNSTPSGNHDIQRIVLSILTTLAIEHADGIPLLGSSSSLIQRLIVKTATDAALVYETSSAANLVLPLEK